MNWYRRFGRFLMRIQYESRRRNPLRPLPLLAGGGWEGVKLLSWKP